MKSKGGTQAAHAVTIECGGCRYIDRQYVIGKCTRMFIAHGVMPPIRVIESHTLGGGRSECYTKERKDVQGANIGLA